MLIPQAKEIPRNQSIKKLNNQSSYYSTYMKRDGEKNCIITFFQARIHH